MTDITEALRQLRPSSSFSVSGKRIKWCDPNNAQPTEEEIQTKLSELRNAEPMRLLREERNRRLVETDWTQYRDVSLNNDSDWQTYRQSLRDLPSTSEPTLDEQGNLTNVTWPTKPE